MSKYNSNSHQADSVKRNPLRSASFLRCAAAAAVALALALAGLLTALPDTSSTSVAASTLLEDSMDRTESSGWGTAPNGIKYTANDPLCFSVSGGAGYILVKPGEPSTLTSSLVERDLTAGHQVAFSGLPSAGSIYSRLRLRNNNDGYYQVALRLQSDGSVDLELSKFTPASGHKILSSHSIETNARSGTIYQLDFSVVGTTNVALKARAYVGNSEPKWQIESTDSSLTKLTNPGSLSIIGYESAGAKSNVAVIVDNLTAVRSTSDRTTPTETPEPAPDPTTTSAPTVDQTPEPEPSLDPISPTALYVSAVGSDRSAGTSDSPVKTISRAVSMARSGRTIVVRGGTYRESVLVPVGKTLHIRSYPGEKVWLDGSKNLSGFVSSGSNFVLNGWKTRFDSSPTYTRGASDNTAASWRFVNSDHPMAAHPDQVWVNGAAQEQVASVGALAPGKFFVDETNKRLYLGSNPSGMSVSASVLAKAISIRGDNSSIDGINVRKYAPSVPDMGAVTAEKPGIIIKNLTVEDSATTGINISAINNRVKNVIIKRSGMLGMNAVYADGLKVLRVSSMYNNTENFNYSPVSGGIKIGRSRDITVKNSALNFNSGPGLWIDESVYKSKIIGNEIFANLGHGLTLEISAISDIVNNRIINNVGNGIKLNNSSDVRIWNNTISGKNRTINAVQDKRRGANKSDRGHDPRQTFPDSTMPWINKNISISNNVLGNIGGGNANLAVEDFSKEFTADQMNIFSNGNLYHRVAGAPPLWSVVWAKAAANPAVFTTLADFQKATGHEASSQEVITGSLLTSENEPSPEVTSLAANVAQPLPADLAELVGKNKGTKHLGAFNR